MKLILKNSKLVFETEAQKIKVAEVICSTDTTGRLNEFVTIDESWGASKFMFKATKLDENITMSGINVFKRNTNDDTIRLGDVRWDILSELFDFTGYHTIQLFVNTGLPADVTESVKVEIYKYDV